MDSLTCEMEWKVYNFDKHEQFLKNGQFLTSKQFYNQKCPSVKWELRVYTTNSRVQQGYGPHCYTTYFADNSVSLVQVGLKDMNDSLKAKFNIYILGDNGNKSSLCGNTTLDFKNELESNKYSFTKRKTANKTIEKYSEDLFSVAHKYEVKQLMEICENYMAANIDTANFSKRCSYAELYRLSKLEKACFNYFSSKRGTFILSKEWNNFKTNNKDFAFRLLEEKQIFGEKIGK
uniref:MATH domain-containing protein n=1 Tax=Meloidogyne javanica TaxID=6303 RepID=A0A915MX63_MELJA